MKKGILSLLCSLLLAGNAFASEAVAPKNDNDVILVRVEKKAEYVGGTTALVTFLKENIKYPEEALKNGTEGTVYVNFIVNKDGSISDVEVNKSAGELLDAEAVRVVKLMPNWIPAEHMRKVVRSRFMLPISFKLPK